MALFEDLTLTWKGLEKTVKADNILPLIAKVEDIMTLNELYAHSARGAAPLAKISLCFGIMLRYAGHSATDDDVYENLACAGDQSAAVATLVILKMMTPPAKFAEPPAGSGGDEGKQQAASNL